MNEIRASGPLLFTEPNNPTRVGEIINTLSEIYDIPMPRLGMSVYVKDEGVNYTITKLEPKLIEGVLVPDAKVAECELQNLAETKKDIANQLIVTPTANNVGVAGRNEQSMRINFSANIPAATTEKAGVMMATDKKKLNNLAVEGANVDLNTYYLDGVYFFSSKRLTNVPILNDSVVSARLTVLTAYDGSSPVITQVLNLNNLGGGEGNIYIRSRQNGTWKPWGKLQTNIEVGQITPDGMSNLIDDGIYSGVCVDGAIVETFILIVINNYLAASQAGFGSCVSQLKYSIDLNRGNTVKTRTRDEDGIWNEWSEIGGSTYELPKATLNTLGGVKLGTTYNNNYTPLMNIDSNSGGGAGIKIDPSVLVNSNEGLTIRHNNSLTNYGNGLSVRLGSGVGTQFKGLIIPCIVGTGSALDGSTWIAPSVGIPYNKEQFCLKYNGLNLMDGIASGVTKVTWDANSNMNDYMEPGIYDIYGERTVKTDNLPITNDGSGHSFAARLTVVASTLQPNNTEKCITQFLQLSNRMGGEGNTYIRTYNENNNGLNGWSEWKKLQGMVESYINTDTVGITTTGGQTTGLNSMTETGMYSGIYTDDLSLQAPTFVETFVLVVINDYAVSGQAGTPRRISQLKYATDTLTGQCTVKKRIGTGSDSISWGDWEDIGGGGGSNEIELSIDTIFEADRQGYTIKTFISQGLIKENITYVLNVSNSYWYDIKTFFSSKPINTYFEKGSNGSTTSELKIIYRNHYNDAVLWIEGYNAVGDYYIISIKNPHEDTEVIKVSPSMTVLE